MKNFKDKNKENYFKLKGSALRYGIPENFYTDLFIQNHKLDYDQIKNKMIIDWAKQDLEPVNEITNNYCIDAIANLEPNERLIFNMHCIDNFSFEQISILLKINQNQIIETYNQAKYKLENDEKIITYLSINNINLSKRELSIN